LLEKLNRNLNSRFTRPTKDPKYSLLLVRIVIAALATLSATLALESQENINANEVVQMNDDFLDIPMNREDEEKGKKKKKSLEEDEERRRRAGGP